MPLCIHTGCASLATVSSLVAEYRQHCQIARRRSHPGKQDSAKCTYVDVDVTPLGNFSLARSDHEKAAISAAISQW